MLQLLNLRQSAGLFLSPSNHVIVCNMFALDILKIVLLFLFLFKCLMK